MNGEMANGEKDAVESPLIFGRNRFQMLGHEEAPPSLPLGIDHHHEGMRNSNTFFNTLITCYRGPPRPSAILTDRLGVHESVLHLPGCAVTHSPSDCILLKPGQLVQVEGRAICVTEEADAGGLVPKDVLRISDDPLREALGGERIPLGVHEEELPRMVDERIC